MAHPVKIGIIGGGMIAQVCHIPFYLGNPDCTVVGIAESRPSLQAYLKNHFKISNVVSDYREILNNPDIDAVILSAPRPAVGPLTLECLHAGKHVLTEKPMAHTVEQARLLVQAAETNNLTYGVAFMKRHDHGIVRAKELFDELTRTNRIGALLSARFYNHARSNVFAPPAHQRPLESRAERFESWQTHPGWLPQEAQADYAWFMNSASHDINLIDWFFKDTKKVDGAVRSDKGSMITLLSCNDMPVSFELSKTEAGMWLQGAEFFFEKGRLALAIPSPMDIEGVGRVTLIENDGTGTETVLETGQGWSFKRQADDFVVALLNGTPPATSGSEALRQIEMIEHIWRKALGH